MKIQNYNDVFTEISPFNNKNVFLIFGALPLFLAAFIPVDDYYGVTRIGQAYILDAQYRLLFDILNVITIITIIYIFIKYKFRGFSLPLERNLFFFYKNHILINHPNLNFNKVYILLIFFYVLFLLGIILNSPREITRWGWFYSTNIYISAIFSFIIYYLYVLFFVIILVMNALKKYIRH